MAETLTQLRSRYRWDPKSLRYRTPTGRFVSQRALKQSLNTFVRRAGKEIEALTRQVTNGTLSVPEWQRAMVDRVKGIHLAQSAAAHGGWAQMTSRDFGRVGSELRRQYRHLRGFAKDVASGRVKGNAIVARARLYANSGVTAYERARNDAHNDLAATGVDVEVRNQLGKGEHCKGGTGRPGCVEESERGWVKLGGLSLPGERRCLVNCKCRLVYRIR